MDDIFMSVYFIDGPPASGKSTLIGNIRGYIESSSKVNCAVVDEDFMFLKSPHKLDSPEYSCDWVDAHIATILTLLHSGVKNVFVDSSPWIALAYHPEIEHQYITEAMQRLSMYKVHLWFIYISWEETWTRIQSRLRFTSPVETLARKNLGETNYTYMENRFHSLDDTRTQYDKVLPKYHLLSLAKSVI